jgi:hypothetical protein
VSFRSPQTPSETLVWAPLRLAPPDSTTTYMFSNIQLSMVLLLRSREPPVLTEPAERIGHEALKRPALGAHFDPKEP